MLEVLDEDALGAVWRARFCASFVRKHTVYRCFNVLQSRLLPPWR
jgi:hypothetical protein